MSKVTWFLILVMASLAENAAAQTDSASFAKRSATPLFNFDQAPLNSDVPDGQTDDLKIKTRERRLMDFTTVGLSSAPVAMPRYRFEQDPQQQTKGTDPIWNGAWIGAAVGGGFAVLTLVPWCQSWGCEAGPVIGTTAILVAAGAGIGALIDQALSVAPIVTKERKGAVVSVAW
jgi:hypothetical protein